jgi:hypothetical protein
VTPADLTASPVGAGEVALDWDPIRYTDETGGYEIWYSVSSAGLEQLAGKTKYKTDAAFRVGGLTPGRRYFFSVRAFTGPHPDNVNTVFSELSRAQSVMVTAGD